MRFSLKFPRLAVASLAAILALGLAACGDSATPTDTSPSESAATSVSPSPETSETEAAIDMVEPSTDLSAITVSDTDVPEVTFPAPWGIDKTQTEVLRPGGGQKLAEDSTATLNYVGINGRTGEVFDSSYERGTPATFLLQQVVPGFTKGLTGQSVGSRVLIAMPGTDGYAQGNPAAGIEVGDSILFVVDILSSNFAEATGEAVVPAEGLPTVAMTEEGPEITVVEGAAKPAELVIQPLIKGTGQPVTEASSVQVKYRSWDLETGALIEDAWRPQQGELAGLIEGWRQGLVGQTTGSRIMLLVPPELAYPDGNSAINLEPGKTLVYVIDLLYASEG